MPRLYDGKHISGTEFVNLEIDHETIAKIAELTNESDPQNDCMYWLGNCNNSGYPIWYMKLPEGKANVPVQKLIYRLEYGEYPEGKITKMSCFNRNCVNIEHIEVYKRNEIPSKYSEHRQYKEARKLTDIQVKQIRDEIHNIRPEDKNSLRAIAYDFAQKYNVTMGLIQNIMRGDTYKHVN